MSSAGIESEHELLLPEGQERSSDAGGLSKLQPCANFLLNSVEGVWYAGTMYKEHKSLKGETSKGFFSGMKLMGQRFSRKVQNIAKTTFLVEKETKFVSYKFVHEEREFCLTFRKHPLGDGDSIDMYNIRLSLIKKDDNRTDLRKSNDKEIGKETPIICRGSESLIIKTVDAPLTLPDTLVDAKFSSITSGDTPDQIAVVRGMKKFESPETDKFSDFFEKYIKEKMYNLARILVEKCYPPVSTDSINPTQGGATRRHTRSTRRRKGVFKIKGKKSYKKKKYGKTKKSRRFRRSGRSRR